jgi:cyanate lyase
VSAINVTMDVERVPDAKTNRVRATPQGKYLPSVKL